MALRALCDQCCYGTLWQGEVLLTLVVHFGLTGVMKGDMQSKQDLTLPQHAKAGLFTKTPLQLHQRIFATSGLLIAGPLQQK